MKNMYTIINIPKETCHLVPEIHCGDLFYLKNKECFWLVLFKINRTNKSGEYIGRISPIYSHITKDEKNRGLDQEINMLVLPDGIEIGIDHVYNILYDEIGIQKSFRLSGWYYSSSEVIKVHHYPESQMKDICSKIGYAREYVELS